MIGIPTDDGKTPIQLAPARVALARTVSSSISSSTAVAIDLLATFLRCYAKTQDVYLKWGSTTVTSSNFDEVIPAGQMVDLVIPVDLSTGVRYTTLRIIEDTTTATIKLIQK